MFTSHNVAARSWPSITLQPSICFLRGCDGGDQWYWAYLWMQVMPMVGLEDPRTRRSLKVSGAHVMRFMPPINVTVDPIDEAI